MLTNIFLIDI